MHIFTFFRIVPFLLQIPSLALYFQRWYYIHIILLYLAEISALHSVIRNIEDSLRNDKKPLKNYTQKPFSEFYFFQFKNQPIAKMRFQKYSKCSKILTKKRHKFLFFSGFFVNFSASFQYFLKRVLALKFSVTTTEYYAYNSVPSVERIVGYIKLQTTGGMRSYWR